MKIELTYCAVGNYEPRAVGLAEELLKKHKSGIDSLLLIPSDGGRFEVKKNGELVFSKLHSGRFPEDGEVDAILTGNQQPVVA